MTGNNILIIGAGPAGLASALALRAQLPDVQITILEKGAVNQFKPGETVPGRFSQLLDHLGILDSFLDQGYWPAFGKRILWGHYSENNALYDTEGHGWHLSRPAFDNWLIAHCEKCGIEVLKEVQNVRPLLKNKHWEVTCGAGEYYADFLINATGNPTLMKRESSSYRVTDHLVATYFNAEKIGETTYTTIASAPNGWWYQCNLTDRSVFTFFSDPQQLKQRNWSSADAFLEELPEDEELKNSFCLVPAKQQPTWFNLLTHHSKAYGDHWLAVGDALMKYDPLSGQGIYKGFETAIWASLAIRDYLKGDSTAMNKYKQVTTTMFQAYEKARNHFYQSETAFNTSFWTNRIR